MTTIKKWRFHEYGGPEKLQLDELPISSPKADEVLINVEAMSLNRSDSLWLANNYVEVPTLPSHIGYEVSGTIEEVGADVKGLSLGQRVSTINAFSISDYGNFGEKTIISARAVMPSPQEFTPAQEASFSFSYFTGYFALFEYARLLPHQTVLITGATSTTGFGAIYLAKKIGATVIATTRTSKKKQALLDAGADFVVATEEEDLVAIVKEITNGYGVDVIYDAVAGSLMDRLAECVKIRGYWIVYGLLDDIMGVSPFPWWAAFSRSFHFYVYKVFHYTGARHQGLPGDDEAYERARRFIEAGLNDGSLPPVPIDKEFQGIESLPEAMSYMESNQAAGKIVVTV
ncbi:zinc-dependent alcohol dehydrogenase family protein [Scytonema sp. NUACC26]|uniref:zinc-dependent alcohol dehydrogenase family protein n=1 Tax=Scytonema sp. NUACC26 TaxID=3140176 RepID=UPI0034DBFF0F